LGCHTLIELILRRDITIQISVVLNAPSRSIVESIEMLEKVFVRTDIHLIVGWELMHHINAMFYHLLDDRL